MGNRQFSFHWEHSARYLGWGIRFFLAAALTAAVLSDGSAPFALGCVAACGAGGGGLSALLGTALGAVLFLDFSPGLAHLAAAILIVTASAAFQGLRVWKRPGAVALCAATLFLAVKLVYVLQSFDPLAGLAPCLTAAVLVGLAAFAYAPLLAREPPELTGEGVWILAVTLLSSLAAVTVGGVSLGHVAMACLVLTAAWRRGTTFGMTLGLCAGLLMDLCADHGALFYAAAYGFGGLLSGRWKGGSRLGAAGVYLGGTLLLLAPVGAEQGLPLLLETALACPFFLLIPARAFGGRRLQREESTPESEVAAGLKARLTRTAAAFRDLYDSMGRTPPRQEENPAIIFDRSAEKICRSCALCATCWKQEYVSTFNALNDATPYLMERGRVLAKDFPKHFADRCIHLPEFMVAINGELSAFLLRRQYRRQLDESRKTARGQYAQLGELLSATAAGLGVAKPVANLNGRPYQIGVALRPKTGENVCGDSVASFETDSGTLCLLLSDGSGSGEGARKESALTNRLLRQFLEAGIEPEAALKTLNAAMALRGEETGSFATVDLLTVSLSSGAAALYKYGAAPTYVKRGGAVRRITGHALPAGLREAPAPPDVTRLTLEGGSFTVMISDGVADALGDEWVQDLLAGWDGTDPQTLAGLVLQEAVRRGSLTDDCGVQVLAFPKEGADTPV